MLHFKNQFCANNAKGFLFKFCDGISRKLFLVLKILTIPLLILTDIHSTHCIAAHIKYWNKICLEKNIDSYIIYIWLKTKKISKLRTLSKLWKKKLFPEQIQVVEVFNSYKAEALLFNIYVKDEWLVGVIEFHTGKKFESLLLKYFSVIFHSINIFLL